MSDDFERLRHALSADAAPEPDPQAKARTMALALENFDRFQGSTAQPRQGKDRPRRAGFLNGVRGMSSFLSSRSLLAATGSLAALCIALVVVVPAARRDAPRVPAPAPQAPTAGLLPETAPGDVTVVDAPETDMTAADKAATAGGTVATSAEDAASDPIAAAPLPRMTRSDPSRPVPSRPGVSEPAPAPMAAAPEAEAAPFGALPSQPETEAFANAPQDRLHVTAEEPVSTFSIDVDTASYSIVRSSIEAGLLPPHDAVRIEEMINYFPYSYPAPQPGEAPFRTTVTVTPAPWNPGTKLVHIGLQGRLPDIGARPPLNLVFLIDTSGSMQDPAKLPLLKQSFGLMLGRLRPEDQVAIVAYAGSAGEVLAPTPADRRQTILDALDRLDAGGATAGEEGLRLAYRTAAGMAGTGEVSRVILATDGDFNVGVADPDELTALIATERASGVYLSVLGFGRGNLDDAAMQALAQNGNGQAAYIDRLGEAQKVLVDQLSGALFPIANDVKLQVEWNPATVAEYRLIGYETRALAREDFANDRVDAGEIGAGHSVTAIYEITPADSPARLTDPLRYGTPPAPDAHGGELGFLKLRYKAPGETASALIRTPITATTSEPSEDVRFATAIAGFGQLLRGSDRLGDWGWPEAIALAEGARGADPFGYRIEAVNLMRLARSLSDAR